MCTQHALWRRFPFHCCCNVCSTNVLQDGAEYDGQIEDVPEDATSQGWDVKATLF